MDLKDEQDELGIIAAAKDLKPADLKPAEMTREQQTKWIVGILLVIAFVGLGLGLKIANEDPRYPGCTGWFGIQDHECRYKAAIGRLGG